MQAYDDLISAELLYAREHVYENNWYSSVHSHAHTELFFITCGEGVFSIAGNNVSVTSGDFLIINPNVPHTEFSSKQNALGYLVIGVENVQLAFGEENERDFMLLKHSELNTKILPIFAEIYREFESREKYSAELCQSLLRVMFLYLLKFSDGASYISEPTASVSKECAEVKRYIDAHFRENLNLDFLSQLAHLNKFYLVHSFKRAFGMTPINYLQFRRIAEGRRLLLETDMTISQIAQALGFASQSSFTQCFKKTVLLTPTGFRKSADIT